MKKGIIMILLSCVFQLLQRLKQRGVKGLINYFFCLNTMCA
jgi:hypothetical protein